ncbi:MAG: PRC-barrel domain-containing protein [Anaerolineales bacterium]|nr:PRC-barrel domain-containing protein [Anaerolineales bacterium]
MTTPEKNPQDENRENIDPEAEHPELEQIIESSEVETLEGSISEDIQPISQQKESQPAQIFLHKMMVNIENGEKLGNASDLLFDRANLKIAAVTVSTGGLLQRGSQAILVEQIQVWGKDFILVQGKGGSLQDFAPGSENWLSLTNNLKGKQVISSDGIRLGQIEDVSIDASGKIVDFRLSQALVKAPLYESMRIPAAVTHALGKDALIIDREEIPETQVGNEIEG